MRWEPIPDDPDIISLGFVSEEHKFVVMRDSVALVLASEYESLSIVVLESMAARVPVIVSAIPGNLELVANGETGIVTPTADPPALATAISAALAEPDRARQLAAAAYRRARANFSIEAVADQYAALYCELLRAPRTWDELTERPRAGNAP
jgi:glycosyltransferase involved in cell wall biosynthesis